jgi:uncharacterized protein DUF6973
MRHREKARGGVALSASRGAWIDVEVRCAGEADRLEDAGADELEERHSARFLDDHAGEGVVGIAVLPARAGLKVERLLGPRVGDRLRGGGLEHPRHHVVLGPEVLVAGGVGEEHADGDFVAAGQAGNVFRDGVVEAELAVLLEKKCCHRCELLATSDPFYRLGTIHAYRVSYSSQMIGGLNLGALQLYYPILGRFIGDPVCAAGTERYGLATQETEYGASDDGAGTILPPDPPADPPPGVDPFMYFNLTPRERELMWKKFHSLTWAEFNAWLSQMEQIKSTAENWSASEEPEGGEDGPQDALRHALWSCLMARAFGDQFATLGHEEGGTDPAAYVMDVFNNRVGRKLAELQPSCEDAVSFARDAGWLILQKGTFPTSPYPSQPNPPGEKPPLNQ